MDSGHWWTLFRIAYVIYYVRPDPLLKLTLISDRKSFSISQSKTSSFIEHSLNDHVSSQYKLILVPFLGKPQLCTPLQEENRG
jgi:hypothetical protein